MSVCEVRSRKTPRTPSKQDMRSGTLALLALPCAAALVVGTPAAAPTRGSTVKMMPKFLKELFPNLKKPDFGGGDAPAAVEGLKAPALPLNIAGKGMSLLGPVFSIEADLQALALNLGSYDEADVQAEIQQTINSAPVVVYTYGLSPFSTETIHPASRSSLVGEPSNSRGPRLSQRAPRLL